MRKEDIAVLAQLLTAMKDNVEKIERAQKNNDSEQLGIAKKEILIFQRKITEILSKKQIPSGI